MSISKSSSLFWDALLPAKAAEAAGLSSANFGFIALNISSIVSP